MGPPGQAGAAGVPGPKGLRGIPGQPAQSGAVYTRWGRTSCDNGSYIFRCIFCTLVYMIRSSLLMGF